MFNQNAIATRRNVISKPYCVFFIFSGILLHQINGLFSELNETRKDRNNTLDEKNDDGKGNINLQDHRLLKICQEGIYNCSDGKCINETLVCDEKNDYKIYAYNEGECEKLINCVKTEAKCCILNIHDEYEILCRDKNQIFYPNQVNKTTTALDLSFNNISTLRSYMFQNMRELRSLNLSENGINNIEDHAFSGLVNLEKLYLNSNHIKKLTPDMFRSLSNLRELFLQHNELVSIDKSAFRGLDNLITLNLSSNGMTRLESHTFEGLHRLRELILRGNAIAVVERFSFLNLHDLKILDLQNNKIRDVDENLFEDTIHLEQLATDEPRFCCMKRNVSICIPSLDQFSSCDDLMANNLLKSSIWIFGVIVIIINLFVIISRSGKIDSNLRKINSFLIRSLALSDLFMGVYLLTIAFADLNYRGQYYQYDFKWRTSWMCNFAGFVFTFSNELTVFTLTVITVDRSLSIVQPFRTLTQKINTMRIVMGVVWVLALIISLLPLPLFNVDYFDNFYGRSGVCLPLHITKDKPKGWQYAVFIFIVLNGISFIVIALSYVLAFLSIKQQRAGITSSNRTTSTSIASRMALLVSADAICGIPIITLGMRSLLGYNLSQSVYAWVAVFILPLNAIFNPILYTISTKSVEIKFRKKIGSSWSGNQKIRKISKQDFTLQIMKTVPR